MRRSRLLACCNPVLNASRRAILGWLLFDWACQPFFTLVTTFVFAPYFAAAAGARSGDGAKPVGLCDRGGGAGARCSSRRCSARSPMRRARRSRGSRPAASCCSLASFAPLVRGARAASCASPIALVGFAFGTVAVEVAAVFNNAMIPHLVPPERYGRLSGTGWAIGYCGGLVSLVIVLGFLAADPATGRPSSASTRSSASIRRSMRATASRVRSRPCGSSSSSCRCFCSRPTCRAPALSLGRGRGRASRRCSNTIADARRHHERRPLSPRQHGLSGRAGGALRLRRHLRRRRVRLAGDRSSGSSASC